MLLADRGWTVMDISRRALFRGAMAVAAAVASAPFVPKFVAAPLQRWTDSQLSEIVAVTLRLEDRLQANVTLNNAFLRRLKQD